jgi:transcriptional regulator with XRE-family HTH domain
VIRMKPIQCRMARSALGLGVREIATIARVSADTVARFERGGEALRDRTVLAIRTAFERTGVEFTNHGSSGVRLQNQLFSALSAIVIYVQIHRDGRVAPNARLDELLSQLEALAAEAKRRRVTYVEFEAIYDEIKRLDAFATTDMVSAVARACLDQSLDVFVAEQAGRPVVAFEAHSYKIANEIFRESWFDDLVRGCVLPAAKIRGSTLNEADWFRTKRQDHSHIVFFD